MFFYPMKKFDFTYAFNFFVWPWYLIFKFFFYRQLTLRENFKIANKILIITSVTTILFTTKTFRRSFKLKSKFQRWFFCKLPDFAQNSYHQHRLLQFFLRPKLPEEASNWNRDFKDDFLQTSRSRTEFLSSASITAILFAAKTSWRSFKLQFLSNLKDNHFENIQMKNGSLNILNILYCLATLLANKPKIILFIRNIFPFFIFYFFQDNNLLF